jgi:tRNA threonylcarbamoyladenosine biosynthesis protein TsaE
MLSIAEAVVQNFVRENELEICYNGYHELLAPMAKLQRGAFPFISFVVGGRNGCLLRDVWNGIVPEGYLVTGSSQEEATYTLNIISYNSVQTQRLGMCLGELLSGGELILLSGQLGSGKTTFTQGLAKGLQITDVVSSPTFTLLKEYSSQCQSVSDGTDNAGTVPVRSGHRQSVAQNLYHFDLYRLDDPDEIVDLGFEDYFYNAGSGVCVVEWADKADVLWPVEQLSISLNALDEEKRSLSFVATGARYCELLRQFSEENLCDY